MKTAEKNGAVVSEPCVRLCGYRWLALGLDRFHKGNQNAANE